MYKSPANTLFVAQHLIFVPECHSTNTLALQLTQNHSIYDGTLVITDNQTAGRGQRGAIWEAEPGLNLTFSIVFKPTFLALKDQFYLTIAASLAVFDFLASKISGNIHIKWPNDILIKDKKICGILIENQIQGKQLTSAVAGIGFNVNQTAFSVPTATSLILILGKKTDRQEVLNELLLALERRYLQLRQEKYAELREVYLGHLYWRNQRHMFSAGNTSFEGVINGIDASGRLVLDTASGQRSFANKELVYIS